MTDNLRAASYFQPFDTGTLGCERYRIPAILTLRDGRVLAAADMRYSHGSDSPNNIDSLLAFSKDGYSEWEYTVVNHFYDYADGETEKGSASFIDCAIVQSKRTDRIFVMTDAWTAHGGYPTAKRGTGYADIDGKKRMLLTKGSANDNLNSFKYYIGDFDGGFAPVMDKDDNSSTEYTVDEEFRLYKSGEALYQKQVGSDKQVQQNVFYEKSEFSAYNSCYLWLRWSDDNGKTWSVPKIVTPEVKFDHEMFFGVGPGRGFVTEYNGKERIIYCVYNNKGIGIGETVCTIYSDDNGETWQRGKKTSFRPAVGKTSECQIVALPDGNLRMYARNKFAFVAYADSTDGGVSWSKFKSDLNLPSNGNCMVSFINTNLIIGGKDVVVGSFASNQNKRADGEVVVGLFNEDNSVEWIEHYRVNDGFFAYSCLTQLADGNIGFLYEDEPAHITYAVLNIDENGSVSEICCNNAIITSGVSSKEKFKNSLRSAFVKVLSAFNLV